MNITIPRKSNRRTLITTLAVTTGCGLGIFVGGNVGGWANPDPIAPAVSMNFPADDWSSMGPVEFCDAFQAAVLSDNPPDAASMAAAITHAWSFLSDDVFLTEPSNAVVTARLLGMFAARLDLNQQSILLGLLETHAATMTSADSLPVVSDSFHLLKAIYDAVQVTGGSNQQLTDLGAAWADDRNWSELGVGPLAYLRDMLREDMGDRQNCSARWRGSITAPLGGAGDDSGGSFIFSNMAGTSTTPQMRVFIGGELVYGPNEDGEFIQTPVVLSGGGVGGESGSGSAITVEMVNISDRMNVRDGFPVAVLRWKRTDVDDSSWSVVPPDVLTPLEGLAPPDGAAGGLYAEYFATGEFLELLDARVDANVDRVWINEDFMSVHAGLRDQILDELWNKYVTTDYVGNMDDHGPPSGSGSSGAYAPMKVLWLTSGGLDSSQRTQMLEMITEQSAVVDQVPAGFISAYYFVAQYAEDDAVNELLGVWCDLHPVDTQFGMLTGDRSYRVANQMPYQWLGSALASTDSARVDGFVQAQVTGNGDGGAPLPLPGAGAGVFVAAQAMVSQGRTDELRALLDARLSDENITGDARVSWLQARAYLEEAAAAGQYPLAGRQWLDEALGEATSPEVFEATLRDLIARLAATDRGDEARSVMNGLDFNGENRVAWEQQIDQIAATYEQQRIAAQASAEQAHVDELYRRLDEATADGDQERIDRYQRLIAALDG